MRRQKAITVVQVRSNKGFYEDCVSGSGKKGRDKEDIVNSVEAK